MGTYSGIGKLGIRGISVYWDLFRCRNERNNPIILLDGMDIVWFVSEYAEYAPEVRLRGSVQTILGAIHRALPPIVLQRTSQASPSAGKCGRGWEVGH